jgi:hypothetical protein
MTGGTVTLDEAYERLADRAFELPNGFVNHGPMVCEALATLGRGDLLGGWVDRLERAVDRGPEPRFPSSNRVFSWSAALGDYNRLPEWIGHFEVAIAEDGWSSVVGEWVPRLMPGLATRLFHGAIRTAHAVRAIDGCDTSARRSELARSLGYWAARLDPGRPVHPDHVGSEARWPGEPTRDLVNAAAHGAGCFVVEPTIFNLHGVTGAMAVALLAEHLDERDARRALAQIQAEHEALYEGIVPAAPRSADPEWEPLVSLAVASHDVHQVKLVEACRRGLEDNGNAAFTAAAARVTGR